MKNKTIKTLAAQQSLLLNNLDVHVWYLVNPFTYGFVNQAHSQFFGFTPEEMSNKNMKQVFLHRMLEFEVMENEQLFKIGESIEVDRWVKDKNNIDSVINI
jgi:PAS domain-containing protein